MIFLRLLFLTTLLVPTVCLLSLGVFGRKEKARPFLEFAKDRYKGLAGFTNDDQIKEKEEYRTKINELTELLKEAE